jgi:Ca2+-transporting ATPase
MPAHREGVPPDLDTLPSGLSEAEAAERLRRDGPNRIVPESNAHRVRRLLGPLADPMVALLLIAAPTYFVIGEITDGIVALVALVPIVAIGWLLEARAERTLAELRRLTAPTAVARRDGGDRDVPTEALVVGDLIRLHEGDIVPADGVLVKLTQLMVDESSLTGESLPVAKQADGDGSDEHVWAGTTVLSGRALAEITVTGAATRYGQVGSLLAGAARPLTPLQRGVGRLVRSLTAVAAVFCAGVFVAQLAHGQGLGQAVIAGVSLAIAAIPEEFPVIYTLYLALGAWRLAQDRTLVRRLPSVETLGSTTVICTDKTGTLTEGRLAVAELWTAPGVDPAQLLAAAVLACEPQPFDPLDVAIVAKARLAEVDVDRLHAGELVADWPFDPVHKYLSHVWREPSGRLTIAAKGAIEGVLANIPTEPEVHEAAADAHTALGRDGMRVVAVAAGDLPATDGDRAGDESHLRLTGLIGFSDPIRDGVADALAECRAAGIRVVMITGDHPTTAHAVVEGLDLPHEHDGRDTIATGDDIDRADEAALAELVATTNVFARTRPEQKHLLVTALRRRGDVVAMTGDGINDAPALREADIGVAMGRRGTAVARESASLVLLDDNFATIVGAVRDGRRIFDNLTRAFAYLIAFHPPLLLSALVIPVMGRPLLLLPIHLVVLELLLHPIVSLVFQADPPDADAMHRPPRPVGDALRLRTLWRPYLLGSVLAGTIIALYVWTLDHGWPVAEARGVAFTALLASQPVLLLSMRSPDRPLWSSGRRWTRTLAAVVAVLVAFTGATVYLPPLASLLHVAAFPAGGWLIVAAITVSALWTEPLKRQPGSERNRARSGRSTP